MDGPLYTPEYKASIHRIRDLYNEAEVDLKSYGRETNALFVPGVNQLRYAGQHLVRALAATDKQAVQENLGAAERHAQRAVYDINDAAIHFHLAGIAHIRAQSFVNLAAVVPNYADIVAAVRSAKRHIERASDDYKDNRKKLYEETRQHVVKLRDAHEALIDAIPDIAAEAKRQNRKMRLVWVGIWIGVGALILNLLRFLFA